MNKSLIGSARVVATVMGAITIALLQGCSILFPFIPAPAPINYQKFDIKSAHAFLDKAPAQSWFLPNMNAKYFTMMFPSNVFKTDIFVRRTNYGVPFENNQNVWRQVLPAETPTLSDLITPCLPWINCERFKRRLVKEGFISAKNLSELSSIDDIKTRLVGRTVAFASLYAEDAEKMISVDFSGNWIYFSPDGFAVHPYFTKMNGYRELTTSEFEVNRDVICLDKRKLCFRGAEDANGQAYLVQLVTDDKNRMINGGIANRVISLWDGDVLESVETYVKQVDKFQGDLAVGLDAAARHMQAEADANQRARDEEYRRQMERNAERR